MNKPKDLLYQDFREDCTISLFTGGKVQVDYGHHGHILNVLEPDETETETFNSQYVPSKLDKIGQYLSLLYEAQKANHSVHDEITEALKQFKQEAGI